MTSQTKLLYLAILAQVAIPICVLLLNAKRKAAERRAGNVHPDAPINNQAWALPVLLASNSLANQFQLPVLFYVLCLMLIQMEQVTAFVVGVAWIFVITRWVHAYIHVTSNYIPARFSSFLVGALALLLLFAYSVWAVLMPS